MRSSLAFHHARGVKAGSEASASAAPYWAGDPSKSTGKRMCGPSTKTVLYGQWKAQGKGQSIVT